MTHNNQIKVSQATINDLDDIVPLFDLHRIFIYPSFSSVSMQRLWILNDLFIKQDHRKKGVAKLLFEAYNTFSGKINANRIELATALDNNDAQRLYESLGYMKDQTFCHYALPLHQSQML